MDLIFVSHRLCQIVDEWDSMVYDRISAEPNCVICNDQFGEMKNNQVKKEFVMPDCYLVV